MKKEELLNLTNIEIYELVLQRKLQSFPSGYWIDRSKEEGKEIAIELLRYLIDEKYKWSREEILINVSKDFIRNNKLWTPFKLYFGRAINKYCMAA